MSVRERAVASEPRERSAPTKRRARERVGESEGRSPSGERWNAKEKAMSEDRLDQALQEMKAERVDADTLEGVRVHVWEKMTNATSSACAEFRQDFQAYLAKQLGDSRRLLVEDHLGRCPG